MHEDPQRVAANALHAAAVWLARINADPQAVAVVTIAPRAAIGVWQPGREHVGVIPELDDGCVELCEALAPFVAAAMRQLSMDALFAVIDRCRPDGGFRLQALAWPAGRELTLRVAGTTEVVQVAKLRLETDAASLH